MVAVVVVVGNIKIEICPKGAAKSVADLLMIMMMMVMVVLVLVDNINIKICPEGGC